MNYNTDEPGGAPNAGKYDSRPFGAIKPYPAVVEVGGSTKGPETKLIKVTQRTDAAWQLSMIKNLPG